LSYLIESCANIAGVKAATFITETAAELSRLVTLSVSVLFRGGPSLLFRRIVHWYRYRVAQRRIDLVYGVNTVSKVAVRDLSATGPNLSDAREYDPSPAFYFNAILSRLPIHHWEYAFADLGCGKGLTLMLASRFGFGRIIGVEFASNVYNVALANLHKFQQRAGMVKPVQVIFGDAAEFQPPNEPLVIYLYNPFGREVIAKVLANLEASLSGHPRSCWIVYVNPVHHDLLQACEFLVTHAACIGGESRVPYALYVHQPAPNDPRA
jgi:predicted RNA methylase